MIPILAAAAIAGAGGSAPFHPDASMERAGVPDAYKWRLDALFADDAAFERGLADVAAKQAKLAAFEKSLARPAKLRECLDLYFETRLALNRATLYGNLRLAVDQKSARAQALSERSLKALADFMAAAGFIRREVLRLPDEAVRKAYRAEPKLAAYRTYLDELRRRRAHVLGDEAERVLSLAGDNLWAEVDLNEIPADPEKFSKALLADLPLPDLRDEAGKPVRLTLSNYGVYRASPDRRVRREAVEGLFGTLRRFEHASAAALAGQVDFTLFLAKSRGYGKAIEAYLGKDDIDPAVYTNLVRTVRAHLAPLHRYVALRKRIMGLPDVRLYDLYPPVVPAPKMSMPYDEAVRTVTAALAPLGEEYLTALRRGLDPASGWLDLYPHRDKESGAFCSYVFGVHPFVKMNWFGEYEDLSTLAHEYGHAMHSHLSAARQPYVTSAYVPFIAEIASTFNEKMLNDHLLAQTQDPQRRLQLLNRRVDSVRTTIYRQTLFAEFELAVHTAAEAGTPLTAELLEKTYRDLVAAYYGPDYVLGPDDGMEWSYIPHLYYKFYVFSYATGLSSGIALAERVRTQGAAARDAYLGMLSGGQSRPPLELLRGAGVDLARPDAIEAALRLFDDTLGEMEKLLAAPAGKK